MSTSRILGTILPSLALIALIGAPAFSQNPDPTGLSHSPTNPFKPATAPTAPTPLPPGSPVPKIMCPQPTFDFGEVAQDDKVEHAFEIVNNGEGQLEITNVQPSCSCTAAMPDKKLLGPREKTLVRASLSTGKFQGQITKTVTVMSNDPATPSLMLTITGKVQQPFHPLVTEVNYGALRKGTTVPSRTFDVLTGGAAGTIVDVRSDNPQVKTRFEPLPADQKQRGYRITVDIDGAVPVGQLRSMLTITTDIPAQKSIAVPVVALVEGEININPRTFNFGKLKRGDTGNKVVEVTKSGKADLKIEGVELKPEGSFTAKIEEVKPGESYRIVMGVSPDAPAGYSRGTVTIKTNCEGETTLQVYFYALVQQ